jgi:DDE family transposase
MTQAQFSAMPTDREAVVIGLMLLFLAVWLIFGLVAIVYWMTSSFGAHWRGLRPLATAEFNTIRLRLLKIAARVVETATRVRLAFAAACPEADLFRGLANALMPRGP